MLPSSFLNFQFLNGERLMQILRRSRLGNDTEDITLTPLARGTIAVMDGYDVLSLPVPTIRPPVIKPPAPILPALPILDAAITRSAGAAAAAIKPIPLPGPPPLPVPRLFDVLGLGIKAAPRGIAYDPIRRGFAFSDTTQTATLFLTDENGQATQTINIQYPNDQPVGVEGLAYIPSNSPESGNTFVLVASFNTDDGLQSRLEFIDSNGVVVREIVPQGDLAFVFLTGVCFRSTGTLLVSSDDDETTFELDFKGRTIATYVGTPPGSQPVVHGIEGLIEVSPRQAAAAGGFDGLLAFFDVRTGLQSNQVADYRIGLGLSLPTGLAWDSTNHRFLLLAFHRQQDLNSFISGVPSRLNDFQPVLQVDELTRRITYLPDEQLIAATHANNPRGLLLFDQQGKPAGQINTQALGNPLIVSYIPTTREFVVVFSNQRTRLSVLSRLGTLSRVIDLAPEGVERINAVTFFNPSHPSGGQFLVIDSTTNTGVVTDFVGTKLSKFDVRETLQLLSPTAVASISTGPEAGAFAIANGESSEIVIFRLD
jgi:WD40 repeat protein